jgi:hypothetical protein
MSEYISREAAKQFICRLCDLPNCKGNCNTLLIFDVLIPAADVAPITKSRIVINNGRNVCFDCCGEVSRDFKFCPWCGAILNEVVKQK